MNNKENINFDFRKNYQQKEIYSSKESLSEADIEKKVDYLKQVFSEVESLEGKEVLLDSADSGNIQTTLMGIKPGALFNLENEAKLFKNIRLKGTYGRLICSF